MRKVIGFLAAAFVAATVVGAGASGAQAQTCCTFDVNARQKFVFQMNNGNSDDLYSMYEDGTGLTQLTSGVIYEGQPSFNRDRTKVAFVGHDPYGVRAIYVMNVDGTGRRRVVAPVSGATDKQPSLDATGTKILFASNRRGRFRLYRVDVTGANLRQITGLGPRPWVNSDDLEPAWSPDGTKIAFTTGRFTGVNEVAAMPEYGDYDDPTRISYIPAQQPAWSPKGDMIAYATKPPGATRFEIVASSASGTHQWWLASMSVDLTDPTWSPDGTRILFSTSGGWGPLYSANANGTGNYRLVKSNNGRWIGSAHWGYRIDQTRV